MFGRPPTDEIVVEKFVGEKYTPSLSKDYMYWVIAVARKKDMLGFEMLNDAALFQSDPDPGSANFGHRSLKTSTPKNLEGVAGQTDDDIYGVGQNVPPETGQFQVALEFRCRTSAKKAVAALVHSLTCEEHKERWLHAPEDGVEGGENDAAIDSKSNW